MAEKVNQSKGRQEVCHLLDPWVLEAVYVCVQVPYDNGIPPQESVQFLLRICKLIKSG